MERFLEKIEKIDGGCWFWTGTLTTFGYGVLRVDGRNVGAHRVAYELFVGPIDDGMNILHGCDNPPCCNPAHLRQGTQAENIADMVARNRGHWQTTKY